MKTRTRKGTKPPAAAAEALPAAAGELEAPKAIPQRWAWHYRTLLALRDRLLRDRAALLNEASRPLEPYSMSEADSATDELDHDLALGQLSAEQDAVYEVEAAMRRIVDGSYGLCEVTGKPIPPARLQAIPWTRFGREVEERLEAAGAVGRPHLGKLGSVRGELTGDLEEIGSEEEKPSPPADDESLREEELPKVPSEPPSKHARKAKTRFHQTERPSTRVLHEK